MTKLYVYEDKNDHRSRYIKIDEHDVRTSGSYPRILMAQKLGRPLEPYEDVHHIDGNPANNTLENLEIVTHGQHQKIHSQKYFDKKMICPICNKTFVWTAKQQRTFYSNLSRKSINRKVLQPFCSKKCVGIYGKQEQLRRDSEAECELNGEPFPNGNTVPNKE